ncbi:putative nepenthesin [Medicago truncatula]|uniref:Peptidase aspartic, catalytic n=1 Tax=Medicago truncatula TaxID=3880 RepID=A2Q181_MEDTR|nr:Peptidase aspartic, catalytic [Medicago truncatula]RHN76491.1 putative nepenthesin [Medicago truncatula]
MIVFKITLDTFNLSYNTTSKQSKFPEITAHFRGANVKLDSKGAFLTIYEGIECFAFFFPGGPIFGSLAQRNLLVGYDLEKSIVSFKPIILPNLLGRLIIKFYILFHISLRTNFASIDP